MGENSLKNSSLKSSSSSCVRGMSRSLAPVKVAAQTTAARAMTRNSAAVTVCRFSAIRVMRSFSRRLPEVMVVAVSRGLPGPRRTGIRDSSVWP